MSKKNKDVQPFVYTYTVYNKISNMVEYKSTNLVDAIIYCKKKFIISDQIYFVSFTRKREAPTTTGEYLNRPTGESKYRILQPSPYCILDYFGECVTASLVKGTKLPYKYNTGYLDKQLALSKIYDGLLFKSNNIHKIKRSYAKYKEFSSILRDVMYRNAIIWYYRNPSTMNEIKKACVDRHEYGNIVRTKRNHKNLPNSYDDISCNVLDQEKSWKHNSKRWRQWKSKLV